MLLMLAMVVLPLRHGVGHPIYSEYCLANYGTDGRYLCESSSRFWGVPHRFITRDITQVGSECCVYEGCIDQWAYWNRLCWARDRGIGEFVVGGSYAVGLVLFAILVVINFVVVTKGATRVSEVTARFTLTVPGKQMAIDADLNAGLITQGSSSRKAQARYQSDFYGAMDGASKFVRGDAIAGILILFINIIGGFAIGTLQHGLNASQAAQGMFSSIGDGLVAQIPSMLYPRRLQSLSRGYPVSKI